MTITRVSSSRTIGPPAAVRVAIVIALPFAAALTIAGTYLGKEIITLAGLIALSVGGVVLARPIIGIVVMTGLFLLAAYPTLLQSLGFLTINNLLGVCLLTLLVGRVIATRDLSFLKNRQVLLLALIGLGFFAAGFHGDSLYPLLVMSRGKAAVLDRSDQMGHDFTVRLVFLIFFIAFVDSRSDLKTMFLVFMLALYLAVPSALVNWWNGTLNHGFRAEASITAGSNPNRLGMICLMEVACWWFWSLSRPGIMRRVVAFGAMGAAMMVLLATGSRSALLGCVVLVGALQSGVKRYRVPWIAMAAGAVLGVVLIATVVPQEAWERMTTFSPGHGEVGASSNKMREQTIQTGLMMVRDHPFLGFGIGRFREVSRQIYRDPFWRPPHDSPLWAATEGGLLVLALYFVLLWITWGDLCVVTRLASLDGEMGHITAAIRSIFILYVFFSFFADLYLNPITYIMVGMIICMRRYVERLRPAQPIVAQRRRAPLVVQGAAA